MILDAKIYLQPNYPDENFLMTKKKIDLIFCQVNKNKPNMNFENFLQALTKLAEFKFPRSSRVAGLQKLLNENLLPLYDKIQAQKFYLRAREYQHEINFDELVSILVKSVGQVLLEIYYVYFQHEIRGLFSEEQVSKMNEKIIFEFMRDFDICPTLITKSIAYKIYLKCIENPMPVY